MQTVKKLEEDGIKVEVKEGVLYLNGWAVGEIITQEQATLYSPDMYREEEAS